MSKRAPVWLLRGLAAFSISMSAHSAVAQVGPLATPRVAVENGPGPDNDAIGALEAAGTLPFRTAIRLHSRQLGFDPDFEARLSRAEARAPIWLAVSAPATVEALAGWRQALSALLDAHAASIAILEVVLEGQASDLAGFSLRVAATDARARREAIAVAIGGPMVADDVRRRAIYTSELAPYVDLLVLPEAVDASVTEWLDRVDAGAAVALTSGPAGLDPSETGRRLLDTTLEELGSKVAIHAWEATAALPGRLKTLSSAERLLNGEISVIDARAAELRLSENGRDLTSVAPHRLLFDNRTLATYLIYWAGQTAQPVEISLMTSAGAVPSARSLVTGVQLSITGYSRDATTGRVRATVSQTSGPVVVDFSEEGTQPFVERSGVTAERTPTIGEIIALHQRQQRAQDTLVRNYIAHARMEQHFRPTVADPGYDIVTENRYYVDPSGVEWEELVFSVNGSKWGADRPPLPLLQPEKVLSLPLQLRFDEGYRYRLAGSEEIDGYDCYIVRFEPARADPSLYRGTVWIDRRTFARIRVQAVQGGLSAPVVSNEETHSYTKVSTIGDQPVFLFTEMLARQIVLIAGRNLLVEKKAIFSDFRVNAAEFEQAREAARMSDRIMYRETDAGLRHYVKQDGVRVVSDLQTPSVKAMAMGVTLDPSFAFPLPIFGINYVDFEFGNRNMQLAMLFGGVLAAINVQRQKLGGSPLDASVDLFAIAVPSSDRVYDLSGEREGERVLTWPLSTGLNLGYQYTPFQKVTAQFQGRFDGYIADTTTSESFAVPASTLTGGVGSAWEYRRGGYSVALNGMWFRRAGWKDWGLTPADQTPFAGSAGRATYTKYSAGVSRDFYFKIFHKIHLNALWLGGEGLDRFSKYQFGLFDDSRIHGVPASGVRFANLALARTSYSFNVFEQYRLDVFLEQAWGRDTDFDTIWRPIRGIGLATNLRGPRGTILRVDLGKSRLPDLYQSLGSTTLQVLVLKPLH